ncbi:MAG: hypothetical protein IPP08_09735 [Chlorobiota bacterium]|jgi:predicted thioesterase|nr:hypothetical protein [Chlorobiota bacterium]QQS66042.1 MAG: hypothetical protein IPP08_09735 [Chlorobiota bacterium]
MKPLKIGRTFELKILIDKGMTAKFFDCEIHPLYSTFDIVKHSEYAGRMAILQSLEPNEDAIGSSVYIDHINTAIVGDIVKIKAEVVEIDLNIIKCNITVTSISGETIALGFTKQKVVNKQKLSKKIKELYKSKL